MINLELFNLSGGKIDDLPANYLNNQRLGTILNYGLKSINNYAYFRLKNIQEICISGNFDFIPSNTFVVENPVNTVGTISIRYTNNLKGSGFELNVFTNPNKTLHLEFIRNEKLTYLNETVFGPLFDKFPESTIHFTNDSLDCNNCDLRWIFERRDELLPKIFDASCSDGRSFYNLRIDDFNNCTPNNGKN